MLQFASEVSQESIVDIQEPVKSFIKDIISDIPNHRLELDRAHRVL